jgi:cytochrome c oxidase subunit 2
MGVFLLHRGKTAWTILATAILASPASATPLDYLHAAGARADPVVSLTWGVTIISVVVILIIGVLVAGAVWHRPGESFQPSRKSALVATTGGLSWIWIGVGISSLALLFTVVWTMKVLADVSAPASKPPLTIEVTGKQWWWQVRYLSDDPAQIFVTANEIHIPAGVPVRFRLIGGDVIHSFWIPSLSGKTDTIPGQTNETWMEANAPGIYRGQCTEYCGLQHAKMGLLMIAQSPGDFEAWRKHQLQSPAQPASGGQWAGQVDFNTHCGSCHMIRGTDSQGVVGPDLSHLMQRKTLAAGVLPNDPSHLAQWISDPQGIKPGSLMQKPELAPNELADIQSYLKTLN